MKRFAATLTAGNKAAPLWKKGQSLDEIAELFNKDKVPRARANAQPWQAKDVRTVLRAVGVYAKEYQDRKPSSPTKSRGEPRVDTTNPLKVALFGILNLSSLKDKDKLNAIREIISG